LTKLIAYTTIRIIFWGSALLKGFTIHRGEGLEYSGDQAMKMAQS
jgi:hypothetical protein